MSRRRLDAESIRDALLACSGKLDRERPEASLTSQLGQGEIGRRLNLAALKADVTFRSAYLPLVRGAVPGVLDVFDVADPELVVGQRDVTTVATQALFLLNSPFVIEQAEATAERVIAGASDNRDRVEQAFALIVGRPPTDSQREMVLSYLSEHAANDSASDSTTAQREAWTSICQTLFATAEFRYVY